MASGVNHQRVPSLGPIDSETNPIAASLLMSFKSSFGATETTTTTTNTVNRVMHTSKPVPEQPKHQAHVLPHRRRTKHAPPVPPPPPPVEQDQWHVAPSGRPKFSDVVKKSLHETSAPQPQLSRPATPASSVPASPSLSSFQHSNRHGKPIVVAKVEPMQVSRTHTHQPSQGVTGNLPHANQQAQNPNVKPVERKRTSKVSSTGQISNFSLGNAVFGSNESVFTAVGRVIQDIPKDAPSLATESSRDTAEESEHDDEHYDHEERKVRQRSQNATSHSRKSKNKASKRAHKRGEGRVSIWNRYFQAFWSRVVAILAMTFVPVFSKCATGLGKCLTAIANIVVTVLMKLLTGARQFVLFVRRSTVLNSGHRSKQIDVGAVARSHLTYMALLRQFGVPKTLPLPSSAEACVRRLVTLADCDAYTVLGCRFDTHQSDVSTRVRNFARLLTNVQETKRVSHVDVAQAVFRRVCNDIGSSEARKRYDNELVSSAETASYKLQHLRNCDDSTLSPIEGVHSLNFVCFDCGLTHTVVGVNQTELRRTPPGGVDTGDVWSDNNPVSTPLLQLSALDIEPSQRFLAMLEPAGVYDVSELVACCRWRNKKLELSSPPGQPIGLRLELTPKNDETSAKQLTRLLSRQRLDECCWNSTQDDGQQQQQQQQQNEIESDDEEDGSTPLPSVTQVRLLPARLRSDSATNAQRRQRRVAGTRVK